MCGLQQSCRVLTRQHSDRSRQGCDEAGRRAGRTNDEGTESSEDDGDKNAAIVRRTTLTPDERARFNAARERAAEVNRREDDANVMGMASGLAAAEKSIRERRNAAQAGEAAARVEKAIAGTFDPCQTSRHKRLRIFTHAILTAVDELESGSEPCDVESVLERAADICNVVPAQIRYALSFADSEGLVEINSRTQRVRTVHAAS